MRKFLYLIIGFTAFIATVSSASASFCNPQEPPNSIYGSVYCDLKLDNETSEDDVLEAVAQQIKYDADGKGADLIKVIIDSGSSISCNIISQFMKDEGLKDEDMPSDIKDTCLAKEAGAESFGKWEDITENVYTAYEKERVLNYTKKSLNYEFKASEKYWDGELRDFGDAPFDLIVDLNLIEIVLFGSEATWTSDVWKYPVDEEGGGGEEAEIEPPSTETTGQVEEEPSGTPSDQSVTTEEEVTPGEEGDCVPADDPDADTGDHPGSDYSNPVCGNGTIEILVGEECDDGNTNSGDGCSQYCMTEQTGATQMCQDLEAVTFSKPKSDNQQGNQPDNQTDGQPNDQQNGQTDCPPGTFPKKEKTITGPPPETPEYPEASQSDDYPGPNIGGTMKEFPESKKPPCEPGYSEVKVSAAGEEGSYCMPESYCTDRKTDSSGTVEAAFCVNLIKADRPESPYSMNDGCIDCHITAMTDALTKALETNVSPLENTTGGFAISSRWGPKFSFNLTTGIKAAFKAAIKSNKTPAISQIQSDINKTKADNEPPTPAIQVDESSEDAAKRKQAEREAQSAAVIETLKTYSNSSQVISDQEFFSRVAPLLDQMVNIFATIQNQYSAITEASQLDKKETCKF